MPLLADGMPTVSADGKAFTFKIHDDVNFVNEDGSVLRKMTADDVAYSINRVLDPNLKPNPSPVASGFFGNIVGAADVLAGNGRRPPRGSRSSTRPPSSSTWSTPMRPS